MKNNFFSHLVFSDFQTIFNGTKLFEITSALSQIILLILFLSWILKKISIFKIKNINSSMKIIDKIVVGSNESIIILKVKDKQLVLGITTKKITHLCTISSVQSRDELDAEKKSNILEKHAFHHSLKNFDKLPRKKKMFYRIVSILFLLLFCPLVYAETPQITSHILEDGGQTWSIPVQTLVLLTSLTFLPAFILMMTSFTRIIIVFGLLRNALGTPYAPPNQILIGLALFLTFFIMSPTFDEAYKNAYIPFSKEKISMEEAISKGSVPFREFMLHQTRTSDIELFSKLANITSYSNLQEIPMRVILPSFVTSELKTAFQIGFTIFIPFLIIDLVVASVLMALGMMMVPPTTISLPFKLMLFVLVDGWQLLITSLAQSFNS
ncbi:flagellar biosynthetic protein FliP [Buchnera aphidicola (Muscaphis stroyani)]|uniref:Flagellar biosynthetic protein FliP n=1 Tax=Buchnera aphidicola (Muscaphis stroyani) TaxID=1241869 RepID=A0A4D6Y4B6_9GAMM|nr:flagellar type III secretion system pore protein FliP [Buchnera aphidicola]QCI24187.1 flagellar biosynthetic protein FliP [Buchnera aphidicola (Muscaphis stroyani)]